MKECIDNIEEYEQIINNQNSKLKEYKYKISVLKVKVNELIKELEESKNYTKNLKRNINQKVNNNLKDRYNKFNLNENIDINESSSVENHKFEDKTRKFIDYNHQNDKKQLEFIQEYKDTLNKLNENLK